MLVCLASGASFSRGPNTDRGSPVWHKAIVPVLKRDNGLNAVLIDSNRAGVVFFDEDRLVVYAVDQEIGQLSSRRSPEISSPFRLNIWIVDVSSGAIQAHRDVGTRIYDSSVQVAGGTLLVKTAGTVRAYSPDLAKSHDVPLALDPNVRLLMTVSPTGKTIMLDRPPKKYLLGEMNHVDVLDARSFEIRYSWKESPLLGQSYSISDQAIAAKRDDSIEVADFATGKWVRVGIPSGVCFAQNIPTFCNDDELVYSCDKFIVASTTGKILMEDAFRKGDGASGKTATARNGRFVAVSIDTIKISKHIFTEAHWGVVDTHINVYDLSLRRSVASIEVKPLPKNDYDLALSPSGSKLALLNDRDVSVYELSPSVLNSSTSDPPATLKGGN